MEGEGGYKPPETPQQPEIPVVREGLSAVVLPELGKLNPRNRNFEPVSEQETMDKLNTSHIPQFAFAFFAKPLGERICKVELIYNSIVQAGFSPKITKKLRNVGYLAGRLK